MRIAFHGKGGAGKTTTSAAFIRFAARQSRFVLAADADLNAHLQEALCIDGEAVHLGGKFEEICSYLSANRTDLQGRPMLCTTPPSSRSNFISVNSDDPFLQKYALSSGNVSLLTVGKYQEAEISTTCYHEKLKALMVILHHMIDDQSDLFIADSIAGTDNIATSLVFAFDLNVFVIEPTEKSLQVFQDYCELVPEYANRLAVVANKVQHSEDERFITDRVPSPMYIGALPYAPSLRRFEQGERGVLAEFDRDLAECGTFHRLLANLAARQRDWTLYLNKLRATYEWDCQRWYSGFHKCDLGSGLDAEFNYQAVLKNSNPNTKAPVPISHRKR